MPQKATKPVPEGMSTITPYLIFKGDCSRAIEFYQNAFGAKLVSPVATGPGGKVLHAMLKIGDSNLIMSDMMGEAGGLASGLITLWVYVDDCDTLFNRAVKAGCESTMAMQDAFWGDRLGQVKDPFGHIWNIATWKLKLTPEEIQKKQEEWIKSSGSK